MKAEFDRKNAVVLGVSFDSPDANAKFSKKFDFNFPLLCDTDRQMGVAYGAAESSDTKAGAKRIGVIIGPDGRVKEYFPKVDARAFPREALEKV